MRNKLSVGVYIIIGLAVIGLISQLFTNTANFLTQIFIMIGVGVAIFAAIYFLFLRNSNSNNADDMKKYRQAVKQSKRKYTKKNAPTVNKGQHSRPGAKKVHRQVSHLRVIEGNKSKRKNRANFF